jgi:hypothetical protein
LQGCRSMKFGANNKKMKVVLITILWLVLV